MIALRLPALERNLLTLTGVSPSFVDRVAQAWRPDAINGRIEAGQTALLVYNAAHCSSAEFMHALERADSLDVALGVWPAYAGDDHNGDRPHALDQSRLSLDMAACRFRLSTSAHGRDAAAPWQLRRSSLGEAERLDDLKNAGLLFLQGHAGPMDGAFGRGLTLCARDLHRSDRPALFPCVESGRCFRQPPQGRDETSREGLIDPRDILAPLVVLDGCGSFPVPGSIFPYDQSLLRGLLTGARTGPCVISLGVSSTPMSAIVLFMALLAKGLPLGRVVREVNLHRTGCNSPSSSRGGGVGPWILVGNPDTVVQGLSLSSPEALEDEHGGQQALVRTGEESILLSLPAGHDGPLDLICTPHRWAYGAMDRTGNRYVWLGAPDRSARDEEQAVPEDTTPESSRLLLVPRDMQAASRWRETALWLREGNAWLEGLRTFVEGRVPDTMPLSQLVSVRAALAQSAESLACAATQRSLEIAPSLDALSAPLADAIGKTDLATAAAVAHYGTWTGARLTHLWAPPWHHVETRPLGRACSCGCEIMVHYRRHPLVDLVRGELSCPACSQIGDVAADGAGALLAHASIVNRQPWRDGTLQWNVTDFLPQPGKEGAACASLFDPYRRHRLIGAAQALTRGNELQLSQAIPSDWPEGMCWAILAVLSGASISMFVFEVNVLRAPTPLS